jgi:type II pantothenate kinase
LGLSTIWALFDNNEAEDLESLLEDLATGNSNMVDMTVGDIYGCGYLNLPQNLTASSFGKLKDSNSYARKDLAKSLLFMLLFNLGQISALHCLDLGMQRVAIVGSVFLNEHISRLMKFAFNYSSRGSIQLILCEYSQYLRSMGVNVGNNN